MFKKEITKVVQQQVKPTQFIDLARFAHGFLKKNAGSIVVQENESGFVRFNLPAPSKYRGLIEKLRLNYWSSMERQDVDPETIHNHPRYFESLIINGGYTHELFKDGTPQDTIYDKYRIFKQEGIKKKFLFMSQAALKFEKSETTKKGDIVRIPTPVIHRVLQTQPGTLSLNVVFKDVLDTHYDLYVSEKGSVDSVKTQRSFLSDQESSEATSEAIKLLDKFIV